MIILNVKALSQLEEGRQYFLILSEYLTVSFEKLKNYRMDFRENPFWTSKKIC
jgi:hypothetical protein